MKRSIAFIICCGLNCIAEADTTTQPTTATGDVVVEVSASWVTLKWRTVKDVDYYEVARAETPDFWPGYFNVVSPPGLLANQFDDEQRVDAGTTYYYQVYAFPSGDNAPPYYPIVIREPILLGSARATTLGIQPLRRFSFPDDLLRGKVQDDLTRLNLPPFGSRLRFVQP